MPNWDKWNPKSLFADPEMVPEREVRLEKEFKKAKVETEERRRAFLEALKRKHYHRLQELSEGIPDFHHFVERPTVRALLVPVISEQIEKGDFSEATQQANRFWIKITYTEFGEALEQGVEVALREQQSIRGFVELIPRQFFCEA